jgi:hypothetical protein
MALLVFAALIAAAGLAIAWGTTGAALQQPRQVAMAPITPAHLRMW